MNFNSRQEDILKLWADLVSTLRDPEGMHNLIKDANEAVVAHKKVKEEQRQIMDIDQWHKGLCAQIDRMEEKVKAKEASLDKRISEHETAARETLAKLNEQMDAVGKKKMELDHKMAELSHVDSEKVKLSQDKARLGVWENELQTRETEMKQKIEQVEKAWGGVK